VEGLGSAPSPPSFEHGSAVRRGPPEHQTPVGILTTPVSCSPVHQHHHGHHPPIGLKPPVHSCPSIL